jgi:glycosyltransferase involved in cell wall biosynthesis
MTKEPQLKVAMLAPPWLKIPPKGYGGIESVLQFLVPELVRAGVEVELFTTGDSDTAAARQHWYYSDGQYRHIHKPLYEAVTLPITHILMALDLIKAAGDFDLIHDHNGFLGPAAMAFLDPAEFPPVLHTLHGPFSTDQMVRNGMPDNRPMFSQFGPNKRLFFNSISQAQLKGAPKALRSRLVGAVHNAIDLSLYRFEDRKDDYFITLARFNRDKGQALAAKLCEELGEKLRMAGMVDGIGDPRRLLVELANVSSAYRNNADFVYFRDHVLPRLIPSQIEFIGNVSGEAKIKLIGKAKALLFPIDWEEPFGLAAIEALACGTPVVAMRRGALPELIEHGKTGWLAKSEAEFKKYMRQVHLIDPRVCRESAKQKFSAKVMAQKYLQHYRAIVAQAN